MYYQNYEDYIRSILGYPVMTANGQYGNKNLNTYHYEYVSSRPTYNQDILNLYPEIYRILNPMICKICEANTKPITEELLDQMTDEIYLNIESDNLNSELNTTSVRVNISKGNNESINKNNRNTENKNLNLSNNRNNHKNTITNLRNTDSSKITSKNNSTTNNKEMNREDNNENVKVENRQVRSPRNPFLRDLIKILILNQLLYGNSRPRPRPRPRPQMPREDRYYGNYLN